MRSAILRNNLKISLVGQHINAAKNRLAMRRDACVMKFARTPCADLLDINLQKLVIICSRRVFGLGVVALNGQHI